MQDSIRSRWKQCVRVAQAAVLVFLLSGGAVTADVPAAVSPVEPLPVDTGSTGLQQMLVRLHTTARLMQVVAHPDDEDGGVLTLESRGKGATVLLQTLNRGEGGQNKLGSNLFDVLGVLRTLELTQADRYYGVEQRFTRVADFGYSKTATETFQKWDGHDIPLDDMVRVIRTFQPDVLVARFSGTDRDGHGHHQASAILTREAFRAAADPTRFPEQIKQGLHPWQAKKLYIGNVCDWGAKTCDDKNYTVELNTGKTDPLLRESYIQFALDGLKHQLSQGAGQWTVEPGDRYAFYKLVDSVLPLATNAKGHEKDFFDGFDTSLTGLAARLGTEKTKEPLLRARLVQVQTKIDEADAAAKGDPAKAADALLSARQITGRLIAQVQQSTLSPAAKAMLLVRLRDKKDQLDQAANLAAGVELQVSADVPVGSDPGKAYMAVPGESLDVTARFAHKANAQLQKVELDLPAGWKYREIKKAGAAVTFRISVPEDAAYTRPYWHRNDPERDSLNTIDEPQYVTLPFPPPPVQAHAVYLLNQNPGVVRAVALEKYKDESGNELERAVAVAPAFSVMLEPGQQVIPVEGDLVCKVKVAVMSNFENTSEGTLHLEVPEGWRADPVSAQLHFSGSGEKMESEFNVFHDGLKEERTQIRAVFESNGKKYSEGYSVVTREDLNTFYYYQPATQHVSVVDVKVPHGLKVGYIMGAGDDIPTVLQQIGVDLTMVPAEKLATEDLSQYGTVVLGIRANDTQKEIAENHQKLLDYVSGGGTLIMQYNTGVGDFNKDDLTPFHAQLSRVRVSVEEAPVQILAPDDSVFSYPNKITEKDFDGWVQERGLYFMDKWDNEFKPLLATHDPGEPEQEGGLLRAQYGKGTYIYTGYAFFRQLPAGVPGAIRLYVNLLAAGHEGSRQEVVRSQ
jgi:LmbE family N-acetylglucosaminyl deacetylase